MFSKTSFLLITGPAVGVRQGTLPKFGTPVNPDIYLSLVRSFDSMVFVLTIIDLSPFLLSKWRTPYSCMHWSRYSACSPCPENFSPPDFLLLALARTMPHIAFSRLARDFCALPAHFHAQFAGQRAQPLEDPSAYCFCASRYAISCQHAANREEAREKQASIRH